MGLSDVRSYCCGVALRYAAYRSAAIKYVTHLRSTPNSEEERSITREMDQISREPCGFPRERPIGRLNFTPEAYSER